MRLVIAGLERDGALDARERLVEVAGEMQGHAQIGEDLGAVRLPLERAAAAFDRFLQARIVAARRELIESNASDRRA